MAFETGQDYTETSSGYAQDKLNLTKGGILYDSGCSDNTFIIIYRLRACNKVIGDICNKRGRRI